MNILNYREAILKGYDGPLNGTQSMGITYEQLMQYFSTTVFKGFNDNPTGFFSIYRSLFDTLEKEEFECKDTVNDENGSVLNIHDIKTSFGKQEDKYDQVYMYQDQETSLKIFYNKWLNFSTIKSFSWCDKYKPSDAPDRRIRRLIEKENKKLREVEKKKYNDAVKSLTAFIRKRDPRVKAYLAEQKEKDELRKIEEKERRERERADRLKQANQYEEQEWTKIEESNEVLRMIEKIKDEDMYIENEDFFCVACNKQFRSENQWENHQKSKKHIKNVKALRRELMEEMGEEEEDFEELDVSKGSVENEDDDENEEDNEEKAEIEVKNEGKDQFTNSNMPNEEEEMTEDFDNLDLNKDKDDLLNQYNLVNENGKEKSEKNNKEKEEKEESNYIMVNEEDALPIKSNKSKSKKNKKKKKKNGMNSNLMDENFEILANDNYKNDLDDLDLINLEKSQTSSLQDDIFYVSRTSSFDSLMNLNMDNMPISGSGSSKKKKNKKKKRNVVSLFNDEDLNLANINIENKNSSEEIVNNKEEKQEEEKKLNIEESKDLNEKISSNANSNENLTSSVTEETENDKDKESETTEASPSVPKKLKGKKAKEARLKARLEKEALAETRCRHCGEQFSSKNMLFNHINETGHSIGTYDPDTSSKSKKKSKKRR